ncbi:hypothetical protein [Nocardia arthritidis]|uniref:Uncharacterized protein n=1 Tax=Nocardia arthritidis TaxID=228602 RepID=A0A6G9YLX0_9NOCA|nr:hypothetical protein [Nocardia arthritidis]QIS14181.1 hypothetical protein F5544_31710 [Nocardia arthritidis]
MAVLQLFTPMLYVRDSLEAIAFYGDIFGRTEIAGRAWESNAYTGQQ